jgi:hypothetical protein
VKLKVPPRSRCRRPLRALNLAVEWKKAKLKTEDVLTVVNSGFLREKEINLWRATTGDPYPHVRPVRGAWTGAARQ